MDDIAPQSCSVSYPCGSLGGDASYNLAIPHQAEHGEVCSSPESSNTDSDGSEDVGILEGFPVREDVSPNQKMNTDQTVSSPVHSILCATDGIGENSTEMIETSALRLSQGSVYTHNDCPSYQENIESSNQQCHVSRKRMHEDSGIAESCDVALDNAQEPDVQPEIQTQAAKKLCLSPIPE